MKKGLSQNRLTPFKRVPGRGIEPRTRRFSVRPEQIVPARNFFENLVFTSYLNTFRILPHLVLVVNNRPQFFRHGHKMGTVWGCFSGVQRTWPWDFFENNVESPPRRRAQRASSGTVKTPISSDFINLDIRVFTILPYWILMSALD